VVGVMGSPVNSVTMAFLMWFNHTKIPYLHFLLALCFNHT
jgi:hypothetical protein